MKMGIDYEYMCKLATIESGLNPNARNPRSSARGLYQIINSTERVLRKRYGIVGNVFDIDVNTTMAIYLVKEYMRSGIKSYTSLYLAHFLGKKEFERVMAAQDDDLIKDISPRTYYFNKRLVGNKTKKEFIKHIENKLNNIIGCEDNG